MCKPPTSVNHVINLSHFLFFCFTSAWFVLFYTYLWKGYIEILQVSAFRNIVDCADTSTREMFLLWIFGMRHERQWEFIFYLSFAIEMIYKWPTCRAN